MKKTISALLLTVLLIAGSSLPVLADDMVTLTGQQITKHFVMAEGLEVPTTTFYFTATAVTEDAPVVTIGSISYDTTDTLGSLSAEGTYTLDKNADIIFGTFPHAGTYKYTVTEIADNADGITYDNRSYTMLVYVANNIEGILTIQSITVEADTGKQDTLSFTNTYRRNGSLRVTKKTPGDLADKTKDFAFTITFMKSGTESDDATSYTGKIGEETVICAIGNETTFYLHNGECLVFETLPVGTRYVVTAKAARDGYSPSVDIIENNIQGVTRTASDADALSTADAGSSNLVGENENSVTYANTYDTIPVTGLLLYILPFLLMIVFPALALILPAVIKTCKKRRKH